MSSSKPAWSERELPAFFRQWRTDWKDEDLSPDNYLDFEGGLRFVLAAAWLFCPETVQYRGCVILKERFSQGTVDDWFTNLGDDRRRIEAAAKITVEVSDEEDGSYGPTVTIWTSPAISTSG
ncbi:hypothetical protein ACFVZM_00740 [Streptomyces sioyaensis]|uniref:hypothetical protein n=1 Tax=Streptomyces sioyaensis TaxID=67364 RepID=UPI003679B67D